MALTSNQNIRHAYTTASQKDIHESVLDMVVDTAPMATPLLAMANRGTNPNHTKFEWVLDYAGPYPSSASGLVRGEGDDADPGKTSKRTRLYNYTHIWGRAWSVSHTSEVVDSIGVSSEFDYQAAKAARLTARDFNYLALNSEAVAEAGSPNNSGASRQMSGLAPLISLIGAPSGINHVTEHGSYIGADGTTETLTSDAGFVEWEGYHDYNSPAETLAASHLDTAMQTIWSRGGLGSGVVQVLCGGTLKKAISDLYGGGVTGTSETQFHRRSMGTSEPMEIVLPVDVIVTDFGEMHVHLDQSVPAADIIGFDPEMFNINVLRDFEVIELAKTGPSQHGMVEAEMTCSLLAPNSAFRLEGHTA